MLSEAERKMLDVRAAIMEAGGLSTVSQAANALELSEEAQAEVFKREIELAAPITASMDQNTAIILSREDTKISQTSKGGQEKRHSTVSSGPLLISAQAGSGAADSNASAIRRESLRLTKEERKKLIQEKLAAKKKRDEASESGRAVQ